MASKIEAYGLIGNMRTAALVSRHGSIDWLCAPRFDSDACFTSLLGYDEHGRWSLRPSVAVKKATQSYKGDTLVLETEFVCEGGVVRITDAMTMNTGPCDVVRFVEGIEGKVPLEMVLEVRFGYGADAPAVIHDGEGTHFVAGPNALVLRGPTDLLMRGPQASAILEVKKGDRIPLQLSWHASYEPVPAPLDVPSELARTESFWKEWATRCTVAPPLRDTVMRSLLTLKALTYAPTGGIAAAPTTSLPEQLGGVRNWDYRFCWLRDASLTLHSLMLGGYFDEAGQFRDWVLRAVAGAPDQIQIMYDLSGGRRLTEFELGWLPGYEGSKPVRVGNAASGQFQLDVYGETLSAIYLARKHGLAAHTDSWPVAKQLALFFEKAWQRPDDGIWEVRGGRRHFTHSKVMAWVAVDRMVKIIEEFGDGGDEGAAMLPRMRTLRERIHEEVIERGFNPRLNAFTQSYGADALDASVLLIPTVGFLPASDSRVAGTVRAIEQSLLRDGFVLRYSTDTGADGLPGTEGAFLACSFWLADNYAFAGRIAEAEALFDRLLGLRNHLGLLSEEYDPTLKRQIGNFPQGFSHLALIATAQAIDAARKGQPKAVAPKAARGGRP
jgi:GH15 family glucan-1,4-alpha-glucosidase